MLSVQVGKTKLFFRYWHMDKLASMCTEINNKVLTVQACMYMFLYAPCFTLRNIYIFLALAASCGFLILQIEFKINLIKERTKQIKSCY